LHPLQTSEEAFKATNVVTFRLWLFDCPQATGVLFGSTACHRITHGQYLKPSYNQPATGKVTSHSSRNDQISTLPLDAVERPLELLFSLLITLIEKANE
jgi:hypothetical protein